jgi:hypothetical protein
MGRTRVIGVDEGQQRVWDNLNQNIQNIGNLMIRKRLSEQERAQKIQDAITLAREEAKIKSEYDPDILFLNKLNRGILNGTQEMQPSQQSSILDNDKLLRGMIAKKFGVPFESMQTPEEISIMQERKLQESPTYQENKAKRYEDLISTIEQNKIKRSMISEAQEATSKIPTGLGGRMKMWWNKMFDPENPTMGEWQKIKMVLTDAQLLNTAKTKGAISDKEMALFSAAAANDDIASISAMQPVFKRLVDFIDSEETAKKITFENLYGKGKFSPQSTRRYQIGQTITKGNKQYKIVDFDTDGEPLVELVR